MVGSRSCGGIGARREPWSTPTECSRTSWRRVCIPSAKFGANAAWLRLQLLTANLLILV